MNKKILVAMISGKRPGGLKARPTEGYAISYDKVIISNNSDDYETEWEIVNVPADYVEWYKANYKTSDSAWYAPMNRSYAIKYAREHGYDYLVQLDDNITKLEIAYMIHDPDGVTRRYRSVNKPGMMDDYIEMLALVLENTSAAMAGCSLNGGAIPDEKFLAERYCYSLFALDLSCCADAFHGDFEDDIEYRLKLSELGLPAVMVVPLRYGKTGQRSAKDETGNRAAYTAAGVKRGEHMRMIHGDVYSCGISKKTASTMAREVEGGVFKHIIKPFKVGVFVKDMKPMEWKMKEIFEKYAVITPDKYILKEKTKKDVS